MGITIMSDNINYNCNKEAELAELKTKVCRLEKDFKEHSEKVNQLDKTLDKHAEINIRIEAKMDNIERLLKEIQDEKKQTKSFWRDKGVSIISTIMGGIILAFLLVRFGLK